MVLYLEGHEVCFVILFLWFVTGGLEVKSLEKLTLLYHNFFFPTRTCNLYPQSNEFSRGTTEWVFFSTLGSSYRRKSAAWHKFDMVWLYPLAYPIGEERGVFSIKWFLTALAALRGGGRGGGGAAPCAYTTKAKADQCPNDCLHFLCILSFWLSASYSMIFLPRYRFITPEEHSVANPALFPNNLAQPKYHYISLMIERAMNIPLKVQLYSK